MMVSTTFSFTLALGSLAHKYLIPKLKLSSGLSTVLVGFIILLLVIIINNNNNNNNNNYAVKVVVDPFIRLLIASWMMPSISHVGVCVCSQINLIETVTSV